MPVLPRASAQTIDGAHAGWAAWCASRLAAVTAPTGDLALIETRWLPEGRQPSVADAGAGLPAGRTVTGVRRTDILTGEPEYALRFWDAHSPAIEHFERIDTFPFHPDWVIEATYSPAPDGRRIAFEHIRDHGDSRRLPVPGDIHLALDGTDYTLHAFDDDGTLLLVFGDPTNGAGTYGGGRFLFVQHTPDSERVVLDFNRAFVPPCGFSAQYNCPMPPRQNRFHLPVEAGEKLPVFRDGFTAY
ncbi:hypothetical protein GA0115240_13442 [Streptomyces sp. DvalAA-14]|uniref:DUF1684 domain-containing protein n=1 Tax=unclassified Streptomyces TaxID=2593676 RepID=UPI00081B1E88|nr:MULTISPECIES: DUF1684 domain-containing protein [unclassified Streptomyces]MYS21673.1 DUF1684 domain-containing protein [Streptomyces sp. SID4948]SCD98578.1 hypothetical protein GA0115240_13442 [Streptomyces sp. DvalAA-14]